MSGSGSYTIGFSGQFIEIGYNNPAAKSLAEFLFCDLHAENSHSSRARYDIIFAGKQPKISLWRGDKKLYFGESKYKLAYILINEVIYECIVDYKKGHALHAGALSCNGHGVLVPGTSGSGKSTLVAWLTSKGLNYLTDELVFLAENGEIEPFTRPISLKTPDLSLLSSFVDLDPEMHIHDPHGMMIAHRNINAEFSLSRPALSLILFPKFKPGALTEITKLSSARSCFRLMECYVNARNVEGHGFNDLAGLIRQADSYQVTYGSFEGLYESLQRFLPGQHH